MSSTEPVSAHKRAGIMRQAFPRSLAGKVPRIYAQEDRGQDAVVHVKFFMGSATWFATEADALLESSGDEPVWGSLQDALDAGQWPPQDVKCFGLCDLGMGFPELGYFLVSEMVEASRPLLCFERDAWFQPCTLREAGRTVNWHMEDAEE